MISNLKLLILENPSMDFIRNNIDDDDKTRLHVWYESVAGNNNDFKFILELFLWCCTDGKHAVDTQNTELIEETFNKKASMLGLSKEMLSSLFFSHKALLEVYDNDSLAMDPSKPYFIVFEGLDGSGKSTQISILQNKLKLMGRKVVVTAEPTNSATGGLIRDALSNNYKREPSELAALFLTDRISHNVNPVWGIKKYLSEGADVICDRYYYSTFAYQGLGTDLQWLLDMNLNCPQILKPDLCIYLDVEPRRCKRRVDNNRAHLEIFENESTLQNTRTQFFEVFKKLNSTENIKVIDANRPINVIADEIYHLVINLGNGSK